MTTTAHGALTSTEVADELGVSPQTVRRFANAGVLPAVRLTPTSPRRFHRADVERLLKQATGGTDDE